MTNYYKLTGLNLYWKVVDETTTVFQIKNSDTIKSVTKTTSQERYDNMAPSIPTWESSNSVEFDEVLANVISAING